MAAGTVFMTVVGCFLNAFVLLPAYAKAFGMPIDGLVGMGTAVNKHITDLKTFCDTGSRTIQSAERYTGIFDRVPGL